jgi:RNA recognition motif-containing protein
MFIYVGNLSPNVSESNFRKTFETFGQVSFAIISSTFLKDKYSGQLRGFGFVEMPDPSEARAAIRSLDGSEFFGRFMNVRQLNPSRSFIHSGVPIERFL